MLDAELELEMELEDLVSGLAQSALVSEAEMFQLSGPSVSSPTRLYRDQWIISYHLAQGMLDENKLTDAVFFDRHPERQGGLLRSNEWALRQEWVEIRDGLVRPMLGIGATGHHPASPAVPAPRSAPWIPKLLPSLNRYRGEIPPSLNLYRGEIPLYFLLGWINVESAGRLEGPTDIGELGYFQLHPGESQHLELNHHLLGVDPDYSIRGGIKLVRFHAAEARRRGFPEGTELLWRVTKWRHWLPGVVDLFLKDMRKAGVDPGMSWDVIEQYVIANRDRLNALTRTTFRIPAGRSLGNWEAMVGIRNVNKTIQSGKQLAAGLSGQ
jgi:hypothetical protein